MSELLPSIQADEVRDGIVEYLTTTFALADRGARQALNEFLGDPQNGIFKGPYVRLRLPFGAASAGAENALGWYEGHPPYGHQAAAFARLSSANLGPTKPRPLPTLVTTGTGSGKTEAFLYPILDHVLRAKAAGEQGVKALILYPMNALANDQARRLTELLTTTPALAGIRAGIYIGDSGPSRSSVSEAGLITNRQAMQADPPDILLTNYKMLDQLLLRPTDQRIWASSATSLRYLVLDEFHTYDGAQGTDVAMLLRRLGLALRRHWRDDDPLIDEHARESVLGRMTPIATSATLGSGEDSTAMVEFANTVFGGGFAADSVITETRLTLEEWVGEAVQLTAERGLQPDTDLTRIAAALERLHHDVYVGNGTAAPREELRLDSDALTAAALGLLYGDAAVAQARAPEGHIEARFAEALKTSGRGSAAFVLDAVKAHPLLRSVVSITRSPVALAGLGAQAFPIPLAVDTTQSELDARRECATTLLLAALSHVRARAGRAAATVELHQWVRAVSRVDRVAGPTAAYRWTDDGATALEETDDAETAAGRVAFPAIYCRHCGRSGWGVTLASTGTNLAADDTDIRAAHVRREGRFRALLYAPAEADAAERAAPGEQIEGLQWFDAVNRDLQPTRTRRDDDVETGADTNVLPVLALTDDVHNERSNKEECPSCGQADAIRFLGSAIATLLSVTITTMFGDAALDSAEKKALVFTDSVQDAAHRAGFVQSRSHVFNLRNAIREAVSDAPISLADLVEAMLARASTPERRYRLLPPELVEREAYRPFWAAEGNPGTSTMRYVRLRLAFDVAMEFGLRSGIGRTLLRTGSLAAEVYAGPRNHLESIARTALRGFDGETTLNLGIEETAGDGALVHWVRGVIERARERGAIEHKWFAKYVRENGARWSIWGGRPRGEGMPAFPPGREAPGFPRIGGADRVARGHHSDLDAAASNKGWYARWAARTLGVTPIEGAALTRLLFAALAEDDVLTPVSRGSSGGTVYQIDPARVIVAPAARDDLGRSRLLRCGTCQSDVTGTSDVLEQLDGAPCTSVRCLGTLEAATENDNYYRRLYDEGLMRRVVAHEHTSLLPDEERRNIEDGFKASAQRPDAPNVLVATPTLEMGIDIGDLSTVFLAGLPRTVASYTQRVGRAGRLTGNALIVAFAVGRGEQLPKLGEPLSVIDGTVRPPATYLNAEEILRRQYFAFIIDGLASRGSLGELARARDVLGTESSGSFTATVIRDAEEHAEERLSTFLGTFTGLGDWAKDSLRAWTRPDAGAHGANEAGEKDNERLINGTLAQHDAGTSGLARALLDAAGRWQRETETLQRRRATIAETLDALEAASTHPAATEEDRAAYRSARAGYRLTANTLDTLRTMHWVSALERAGLLPNYTLLDDRVRLDVGISWIDPDTKEFEARDASYERAASIAIAELAPGSYFYAQGLEIAIDAVDLGSGGNAVQRWAYCPECGHGRNLDLPDATPTAACPRCGSRAIADTKQVMHSLELATVSAEVRRDEASISDGNDERNRVSFTLQIAPDLDPDKRLDQWFVEGRGFGVTFYRDLTIRWLNLGRQHGNSGEERVIAGATLNSAPLFRVCEACGKLDERGEENTAREHRPWCPHRTSRDEHVLTLALTRTLVSQGVVVRLPQSITVGDVLAIPSLVAALQLGLREVIGGDPDHLRIERIEEPLGGSDGETTTSLLIHDVVPGGTGYLADLAAPERIREVLEQAWEVTRDCTCVSDGRMACHRCLLPYASGRAEFVSRSSAVRSLELLLGVSEEGAPETWPITQIDPGREDPESNLEQWFRKVFRERAVIAGASIKEQPGAWGNRLRITFPGGGGAWLLTPQFQVDGVRPDFVLEPVGAGRGRVPPIAIFTDGWRYHATSGMNRLADDAEKRDSLRQKGYHVLAVTWRDVEAADSALQGGSHADTPVDVSSWFARDQVTTLASSRGLNPSDLDVVASNPITMLFGWMQDANNAQDRWRKLGDILPQLLLPRSQQVGDSAGLGPAAVSLDALDGRIQPPGDSMLFLHRQRSIVTTVEAKLAAQEVSTETVVALDDRDVALQDASHAEAWRLWLRLSNLLGFGSEHRRARLTTATLLQAEVAGKLRPVGLPAAAKGAVGEGMGPVDFVVPEEWHEVVEFASDGAERELLTTLAQQNLVPVPLQGHELSDGTPVTLSWPDYRIVVEFELDHETRHALSVGGWKIVEANAEAVAAAFAGEE